MALALMGIGFATIAAGLVFYLSGYVRDPEEGRGHLALIGLIALYPSTLISVFFNVALAKAASEALEGRSISLREALETAIRRLDQIALWSLISVVVGVLLEQIASRLPGGGRIATALVGAAWALATIFVVPIVALEGAGAVSSIRRSGQLVRKRWGEGLAGTLTIGFWVAIVAVPAAMVFCIALGLTRQYPEFAGPIAVLGLVVLVLISAVAAALRQVFAVVLYRYAVAGAPSGFPIQDLESPFTRGKTRRSKTRWRTVGYVVGGFFALLLIVAVLVPAKHNYVSGPGYRHTYAPPSWEVHDGMPILLDGRKIGEVVNHYPVDGRNNVVYHVDPRYEPLLERGESLRLVESPDSAWIELHPHPPGS